MLKELSKYENLGTPNYHFELLKTLADAQGKYWSLLDIRKLYFNRVIEGRSLFDGCLPLLDYIGIISIDINQKISTNQSFLDYLVSETLMIDRLVEKLLVTVNEDVEFHKIFCSEYISRDIIYHSIQIDNSAFPLRFSGFKQLLIDFSVLQEHPTKELNKYIINGRYKKIFDKLVLPEIKKRKVGNEEMKKSREQRLIFGEDAEKFVLDFENKRLNGSKIIEWVAEYSSNDGYDIASYETENSVEIDRFIEVKSYKGKPYFFWSRNEMDIARIKKLSYYIYLVNRDQMNEPNYIPLMIRNPFENVYRNEVDWERSLEKIKFTMKAGKVKE